MSFVLGIDKKRAVSRVRKAFPKMTERKYRTQSYDQTAEVFNYREFVPLRVHQLHSESPIYPIMDEITIRMMLHGWRIIDGSETKSQFQTETRTSNTRDYDSIKRAITVSVGEFERWGTSHLIFANAYLQSRPNNEGGLHSFITHTPIDMKVGGDLETTEIAVKNGKLIKYPDEITIKDDSYVDINFESVDNGNGFLTKEDIDFDNEKPTTHSRYSTSVVDEIYGSPNQFMYTVSEYISTLLDYLNNNFATSWRKAYAIGLTGGCWNTKDKNRDKTGTAKEGKDPKVNMGLSLQNNLNDDSRSYVMSHFPNKEHGNLQKDGWDWKELEVYHSLPDILEVLREYIKMALMQRAFPKELLGIEAQTSFGANSSSNLIAAYVDNILTHLQQLFMNEVNRHIQFYYPETTLIFDIPKLETTDKEKLVKNINESLKNGGISFGEAHSNYPFKRLDEKHSQKDKYYFEVGGNQSENLEDEVDENQKAEYENDIDIARQFLLLNSDRVQNELEPKKLKGFG